jgi:hypothetical protein
MIELLEPRRLFNFALTGASGHAGIVVDVHTANDEPAVILGRLRMDYYLEGYFGETAGTEGSSSGINVGEGPGKIMYSWEPGAGVSGGSVVVKTTTKEDGNLLNYVYTVLGGPSPLYLRYNPPGYFVRVKCGGFRFAEYRVLTNNCYTFSGFMAQTLLGHRAIQGDGQGNGPFPSPEGDATTWDYLHDHLEDWVAKHPLPTPPKPSECAAPTTSSAPSGDYPTTAADIGLVLDESVLT